ncbi:MAG: WD40 repeat domain-containing protein [Candidatus Thorarchaeota archaeon]
MQKSLLYRPTSQRPPPLLCIDVDSSCKRLACGTADSRILLINAHTGRPQHALTGHENVIAALSFLQSRTELLSVSWDYTVRKWRLGRTDQERGVLHCTSAGKSLVVHEASNLAAVGTQDGTAVIFAPSEMSVIRTIDAHSRDISAMAFLHDGQSLLTASWDGSCNLWDLSDGHLVRTVTTCGERVQSMVVAPDETRVFLGLHSGKIAMASIGASGPPTLIEPHTDAVATLLFFPGSSHVISGGWDCSIRVWDPDDLTTLQSQRTLTGITDVAVCTRSNLLYVTDFSGTVTQWSLETTL